MSLQKAILGLLTYKSWTGYELKLWFQRIKNYHRSADISRIYRILSSLEEKDLVSSRLEQQESRPDKKVYTITDEGKSDFKDWLLNSPEEDISTRLLFGSQVPTEDLELQLKTYIKKKEADNRSFSKVTKELEKFAEEYSLTGEISFWKLSLRKKYMTNEAAIQWAKECLREIKHRV